LARENPPAGADEGNTRIEFLCGDRALRDYAAKHRLVAGLAGRFSTDWREVEKVVEKLVEEGKELRKRGDELRRELAGYKAADYAAPRPPSAASTS